MSDKIKIALLGLGHIGEVFAEHFLEHAAKRDMPVEIVAVADHHVDSPIAMGFAHSNIPVFEDSLGIIDLGEEIDIIFDLTGNDEARRILRMRLQERNNQHTLIAPEIMVKLLWFFFETERLDCFKKGGYNSSSFAALKAASAK